MALTRTEALLISLVEEQAEVIQRLCKALRFGLDETQPGQNLNNKERIELELNDAYAVLKILNREGVLDGTPDAALVLAKITKIEHFMRYSQEIGAVEP